MVLRQHFNLADDELDLPDEPTSPADVYGVSLRAWEQVNRRISLGRGPEYQLGHGVFLASPLPEVQGDDATDLAAALRYLEPPWRRIRAHIDEVFFGHTRGVAAVLNVGASGHPLTLTETYFAGDPVVALSGRITELYKLLRGVAAEDAQ